MLKNQKLYTLLYYDFVEDRGGKLYGFESKWKDNKSKGKKYFEETYKEGIVEVITQDNYLDFIL